MKNGILIATMALMVAVNAQATTHSFLKAPGARVYVDTMRWSNNHGLGTGGLQDTLKGTADVDTTTEIDLANLEAFSAMILVGGTNTDGGTQTASCSLEVSLDGTNFFTSTGIPVWYHGTSITSKTALIKKLRVYYAQYADSTVTDVDSTVANPRGILKLRAARLGRWKCTHTATTATDTTFITLIAYRSYRTEAGGGTRQTNP